MKAIEDTLLSAAETLNVNLTKEKCSLLIQYLLLLEKWNKYYNLTALKKIEEMAVYHIIDSMAVYAVVWKKYAINKAVICDIGCGAGLPGVVWSILDENSEVRCIDAVEKKIAFLRQVKSTLKLPNMLPAHARVEVLKSQDVDFIVSRAFSSLKDFVNLTKNITTSHTKILAMKAKLTAQEISELDTCPIRIEGVYPIKVPYLEAERNLVVIETLGD